MQSDADKIQRNLGVIAALKQNDKLLTEGDFFTIYVPTAMRSLMRTVWRESRELNLMRVAECIRNAKSFVTNAISEHGIVSRDILAQTTDTVQMKFHRHSQVQLCSRILTSLSECTTGLDNLTHTYADDASFLVKIRQIKTEVTDFIESTTVVATSSPVVARLQ